MANAPIDVFKHIDMCDGNKEPCWPWMQSINNSTKRPYLLQVRNVGKHIL